MSHIFFNFGIKSRLNDKIKEFIIKIYLLLKVEDIHKKNNRLFYFF